MLYYASLPNQGLCFLDNILMNDPQNNKNNNKISADSSAPAQADSLTYDMNKNDNFEQNEDALPKKAAIKSRIDAVFRSPMLTNILLAGLFSNSIYLFYNDYETFNRFSSLMMMVQLCCVTLFFLVRIAPARVSMKPIDWTTAIIGTILPMLIAPVSAANEIVFLMLLQFFGIFISIVAIISLNTSFAIVPALRKVKTGGLYSLIRHPIYFSYFLTFTCVVLQNFSLLNVIILAAIYAADIYRIKAEEELLSLDPGYELYKMRVRYRLIPYLW